MRFDDLLRDRQAEAGIGPEAVLRTVGIEALEDALEIVRPDARSAIVDAELDIGPARLTRTMSFVPSAVKERALSIRLRAT